MHILRCIDSSILFLPQDSEVVHRPSPICWIRLALRIQRLHFVELHGGDLGEVPDEQNETPGFLRSVHFAEGGHAAQTNSILNYRSVLIRVEQPKNLNFQLVRVDFSPPCDKFPERISTNPLVKSFRLIRDKNADAVLSGCLQDECKQNQSLPIWKRPATGNHDSLPFGQMLPSYRSVNPPMSPLV
jgi:hypothetical protein